MVLHLEFKSCAKNTRSLGPFFHLSRFFPGRNCSPAPYQQSLGGSIRQRDARFSSLEFVEDMPLGDTQTMPADVACPKANECEPIQSIGRVSILPEATSGIRLYRRFIRYLQMSHPVLISFSSDIRNKPSSSRIIAISTTV